MTEKDVINHPSHYISDNGLETIDVIEAFTSQLQGLDAVCTANVIKYICRWPYKNGVEDLKKARWYIDRLIRKLEEEKYEEETDPYATQDSIPFNPNGFIPPSLDTYQPSTSFMNSMSQCCSCKLGE